VIGDPGGGPEWDSAPDQSNRSNRSLHKLPKNCTLVEHSVRPLCPLHQTKSPPKRTGRGLNHRTLQQGSLICRACYGVNSNALPDEFDPPEDVLPNRYQRNPRNPWCAPWVIVCC